MSISFSNPVALWLLLILPVIILLSVRSMAGLPPIRRYAAIVLRCIVLTLLILAIAEIHTVRESETLDVIIALDCSDSVPEDLKKQSLQYVSKACANMTDEDTASLLVFSKGASFETSLSKESKITDLTSTVATKQTKRQHTDLASAIRLAMAAFPEGTRKRIVLITDGNENKGDALHEAQYARANDVHIDVLPVRYKYQHEVIVDKVIVPAAVQKQETFDVKVVTRAYEDTEAELVLLEDGREIARQTVQLQVGKNVFSVPRKFDKAGFHVFKAMIEPKDDARDTLPQNNQAEGFSMVRGIPKVLYVEGDLENNSYLLESLQTEKINVVAGGVELLPSSLGELRNYDSVILSDIAAYMLSDDQMKMLQANVKDFGAGLIMIGSERGFGAGGYGGSPIEAALPVSMDLKQRKVMPNGALVLIMHTCEFADGNTWAKRISKKAVGALSQYDYAGLLYYDYQKGERWRFPLTPVGSKQKLYSLIDGMSPGDMPDFRSTLRMAHNALKNLSAGVKHIIIISDGDPQPPTKATIAAIAKDKISITAVYVSGHGASGQSFRQTMVDLARIGKGRFYDVEDPKKLPQIFVREAAIVRRSLIFEGKPFVPQLVQLTDIVTGIDQEVIPSLVGYVATTPKERAEVPLVSQNKDPILAQWRYGLGKAVAFTSDAKNRWATEWVGSPVYRKFWTQLTRWTLRDTGTEDFHTSASITGTQGHVVLDAIDENQQFINFLKFEGSVVSPAPEYRSMPLQMTQTAPGRYEGEFDADTPGSYFVNVAYADESGRSGIFTTGVTVPYSREYTDLKTNDRLLREIAALTGGKMLVPSDNIFRHDLPSTFDRRPAWPLLLKLLCFVFLLDVFVRRVIIDYRKVGMAIVGAVQRIPIFAPRSKAAPEAEGRLSRLRDAKTQVSKRLGKAEKSKKFVPPEGVDIETPIITEMPKDEKPATRPAPPPPEAKKGKDKTGDDEPHTSRLLKAKRRAKKEKEK